MQYIRREKDGKGWIVGPIRAEHEGIDVREQIQKSASQFTADSVSIVRTPGSSTVGASYIRAPRIKGKVYDLGHQLALQYINERIVYIEDAYDVDGYGESCICLVLDKGDVVLDVASDVDSVLEELEFIVTRKQASDTEKYFEMLLFDPNNIFTEKLTSRYPPSDFSAVRQLQQKMTEYITPTEEYEYFAVTKVKEVLRPKGFHQRFMSVIGVLVAFMLIIAGINIYKNQEVEEAPVVDLWAPYYRSLQSANEAYVSLVALYSNLLLINTDIDGWRVTNVSIVDTPVVDSFVFTVTPSNYGSLQKLDIVAPQIFSTLAYKPFATVDKSQKGTVITVSRPQVPLLRQTNMSDSVNGVKMDIHNLRTTYIQFRDHLSVYIPGARLISDGFTTIDPNNKTWQIEKLKVQFQAIDQEKLLKLASMVKDKPISIVGGQVEVVSGRLSGTILLENYGEKNG